MRIVLALLLVSSLSSVAGAAPSVVYNYVTGKFWIINDSGGSLANASLLSFGGNLTTPSAMLSIPGTVKDDSEFPFALTYLGLPPGTHNTGFVIMPGTSPSDLTFEYRVKSLLEPVTLGTGIVTPEPSALALATCGLGLLTWRRGRLKRV